MSPETKYWKDFKKELSDSIEEAKKRNKVDVIILELMEKMAENSRIRYRRDE